MRHSQCKLQFYTMSGKWTKRSDQFFPCETCSVNYERHWKIAVWSCADALHFRLRAEKCYLWKFLLAKFREKNLSHPEDIKSFCPRTQMYMYTLPLFIDAVLSKESQLMKWVGIFLVKIFWVGIFWRELFQGGVWWLGFSGWEFFRGEFS